MNKIIIDDLSKRKNIRIIFKKFQWKNKKSYRLLQKKCSLYFYKFFFVFNLVQITTLKRNDVNFFKLKIWKRKLLRDD